MMAQIPDTHAHEGDLIFPFPLSHAPLSRGYALIDWLLPESVEKRRQTSAKIGRPCESNTSNAIYSAVEDAIELLKLAEGQSNTQEEL